MVGDRPFLPNGPGDWDRGYVHSGSMAVKDDVMYFHYSGMRFLHQPDMEEVKDDTGKRCKWGLGAATLPAERSVAFVQREPGNVGILETPPVRFEGTDLLVNADCEPGDLQVELVNEKGPVVQHQSMPIPGFGGERSRPVRHDPLRYRVVWAGDKDPGEKTLADASSCQPIVIRFLLKAGGLFAFRIA